MKINRRNPWHWLYLAGFAVNVVAALLLRPIAHRRRSGRVLLYGHQRAGNLLAIHEHVSCQPKPAFRLAFLTMDPSLHRELTRAGVSSVLAMSPAAIRWLATADAIVSDHGLHAMEWMLGRTDMMFFDVWHGIPFKGFDASDFRVQRRYDGVFVASPTLKQVYVSRFGFDAERVHATGYARHDRLTSREKDFPTIRREFGLPATGKVVLFAPTWKQDARDRDVFPFGADPREFLEVAATIARRHDATIVVRMHLNSDAIPLPNVDGIIAVGSAEHPDTERLLLATDVLICDWSSIAFDFLLLERPTIFLDVDPPFRKGFSLDPSFRYGEVVGDEAGLWEAMDRYLGSPGAFAAEHGDDVRLVRERVYGGLPDGPAAARCVRILEQILSTR